MSTDTTLERLAALAGHSVDLRAVGGGGGQGINATELGGVLAGTDELGYLLVRYVAVDDRANTALLLDAASGLAAEAACDWEIPEQTVERLAWIAIQELAAPRKNLVANRALALSISARTWHRRYAKPYTAIYAALHESLGRAAAVARRRM